MNWIFLPFLAEPWFVIPRYLIGICGVVWVGVDLDLLLPEI